uniref:Uncharacterized protein n=1 Tax=Panagrolaimus sp. PS1159 TaxID=55785 RepID=A0AC35FXD9_9BILA
MLLFFFSNINFNKQFEIKPIFSVNSRKRKSSPIRWNRGIIGDNDEVEPGQDIIRKKKTHKRFRYQPQLLPAIFFPDEKDPDEPLDEGSDEHPVSF